jgi:hypothetical protein
MMKKLLSAAAAVIALAASAQAAPSLQFNIDGNTFGQPFTLTNNATAGEEISRLFIDLAPTGRFFDTSERNVGVPFAALNGTGAATGLSSFSVTDSGTTLDLSFTDFQAAESFQFEIDVDGPNNITVFGSDLIGAAIFVEFVGGTLLSGVLAAVAGNPDAASFQVTGSDPIPEVPLPAGAALFAAGLGLVGLRRRVG